MTGSTLALEKISEFGASGLFLKDSVETLSLEDPDGEQKLEHLPMLGQLLHRCLDVSSKASMFLKAIGMTSAR